MHLITIGSLFLIKSKLITNTQNVLHLKQCTMDTFRHGRWQHFQALGLTANGLTRIKNVLLVCLSERISEC